MKRLQSLVPLAFALILSCLYMAYGITREAPIGVVEGTVVMKESGAPLADAMIYLEPKSEGEGLPGRDAQTDKDGHFRIRAVAVGAYTVSASTLAHSLHATDVQVDEGKKLTLALRLAPNAPSLDLQASQHVFTETDTPGVHIHGFVPQSQITVTVTRLHADRIAEAGGLDATFSPLNSKDRELGPDHFGQVVQTLQRPIKKDVEGVFHQRLAMPKLGEGIYWVECMAGPLHSGSYLNITHLALISKYVSRKLLAYTVDIHSGKPIPGVPIFTGAAMGLKRVGTTDKDGLADVGLESNQKSVVVARQGDALAICERQMEDMKEVSGPNTVFLYSDRSIYRPGDTIQFKGIVRKQTGMDFSLPRSERIEATFTDARRNKLATLELPVGAHGTFHGSFTTSKEADPGDFQIEAGNDSGSGTLEVPVSVYRKPSYTITVLSDKPYYMLGEKAKATISCQYYYGGPVVGATVHVTVFRAEDWRNADDQDADSSDGGDSGQNDEFTGGAYDQTIQAVTDATGRAVIEFPTRGDEDPTELADDYVYTINANVADVGDKFFEGTGTVKVTRGQVRLNVDTDRYVAAPGDKVEVTAKLVPEPNSNEPIGGRSVEIVTGSVDWDGKIQTFTPTQTLQAVTDATGIAHIAITVQDKGSIRIRAAAVDTTGRRVPAEAFIYVSGDADLNQSNTSSITATLDRKTYSVGETAKLLLQTTEVGGSALVTVQAETILTHLVVPLTHTSTLLTLPVDVRMTPNAFVAVAYIHDEHYMEASKELVVKRFDRDLEVTVTPDRPTAKPGEFVTFDVKTQDKQGHPISTDASLSVVDEAIYAVRKDTTDIRSGFYPHRSNNVMTSYSFPEIYLDGGDKGSGKIPVRSRFLDTAAWTPDVQTGPDGHASVRVKLPDNLTQWRATAVACTDNALVGMSANDITSRKDLMISVQSPPYLVSGDHQMVAITVTNDSGHDADVGLTLWAKGIALEDQVPASIHVVAGKPETVRVDLVAGDTGTAEIAAQARLNDGAGDAVKMPIRIEPRGEPEVVDRSGDTDTAASLVFTRRADVDPLAGGLKLTLNPSIAAGLLKPMGELVDFPYGCVEQTMSRFLPSVLVTDAFKKAGLPLPTLSRRLPEITSDSFTRLARLQHADGGWGWWEYDESSPFMTALVLDGLQRAQEVGYPTPKSIAIKKALDWSQRWLKIDPKLRDDFHDSLYLSYALAKYGRGVAAKRGLAEVPIAKMTSSELAFAALASAALGEKPDHYLSKLRAAAQFSGVGVEWKVDPASEWGEEATGVALLALTTLTPNDPLIPTIVRGLMARRRGDEWFSTRDTAYVLTGISKYLEHSHEADAPEDVDVVVNGKVFRELHLDPKRQDTSDVSFEIPIRELPVGKLTVELRRQGQPGGRVYYGGELSETVIAQNFEATSSDPGYTVSRKFFVLEARQLDDGTLRLLPSATPVNRAPSGSIIRCEITINSTRPRSYVQIECPTPSNCHITEREDAPEDGEWSWWWASTVIREDKIAFFADSLPKGTQRISFAMRAESPGLGNALPVVAVNMYDPTERASSPNDSMEVVR